MQFAALLCAQKREDEAISTLREALAASPDSASLQAALGLALVRANRAEDAARAFRRALALDPELAWAREQLIRVEGNRPQAATESSWR
ncbi:MAG TPA: tetratricopeptide repeat protein [Candidatus Hydrogenedentes bacterium]|nr:tetratricopeptide repeat protein [Candidatus Hydrogenedentota bacterium]